MRLHRKALFCGLLALGGIASPAMAAPSYLECVVTSESGKTSQINVTADEAGGTVTVLIPSTGFSERRNAVFSPTSVKWSSPVGSGGIEYDISRTDLSIRRKVVIGTMGIVDAGTCKVQATPKRAF